MNFNPLMLRLFLLPVLLVCPACDSGSDDGVSASDERHTVLVDGGNRIFELRVPEVDHDGPIPLMIAFHGAGGSGPAFKRFAGLDDVADEHGFLVAYPTATGENWAEGCNCTRPDVDGVDDVGFADAIIEETARHHVVDRSRIYAVGYSQGGLFTQRLACDRSGTYAGIATIAGMMSDPVAAACTPDDSPDIMLMHGEHDTVLPWEGVPSGLYATLGVLETFYFWRDAYECPLGIVRETETGHGDTREVRTLDGCRDEARLRVDQIQDAGHGWPPYVGEELVRFFDL